MRRNSPYLIYLASLSIPFCLGFLALYIRSCCSVIAFIGLPEAVDAALLAFGLLCLLVHCLMHRKAYGAERLVTCAVILAVLFYGYIHSGETAPLTVTLLVIAAAGIADIRPYIKLWAGITLAVFLICVCQYMVSALIDPNSLAAYYRVKNGGSGRPRFSLGFVHPNFAAALVMMLCAADLYLSSEEQGISAYRAVTVIALMMFLITNSFTSLLLTLLLVVLVYAQRRWGLFRRKILNVGIALLPIVLFIGTFLVAGPLFSTALSGLLTGRITLWYSTLGNQGLTLVGQAFSPTLAVLDGAYYEVGTLDSFYAESLCVYGLFFSTLFCWAYWHRIRLRNMAFSATIPVLIIFVLFGITEVHLTTPALSFPALLILSQDLLQNSRQPLSLHHE